MKIFICGLVIFILSVADFGNAETAKSFHFGFLHPNGVDVVGYTVEIKKSRNFYHFYTFGFPSIAATGINYYSNYFENGFNSTVGLGIGSVFYGSVAYQIKIKKVTFLKLGGGYTTGIAYTGFYPVFGCELRF